MLLSTLSSVFSSSESVWVGDGGTTTHLVVTLTFPLARFLTSHKSVSFLFILEAFSTVGAVGNEESTERLDCILLDLF